MQSKFNIEFSSWITSLSFHLVGIAVLGILFYQSWQRPFDVEISVLESPSQSPSVSTIQQTPVQSFRKSEKKARAVYGLSRKALVSNDGPEIKTGNTLTKKKDDLQLKPDDPDQLPVPTEEYLVSQMPELEEEVRVPYPVEAKSKSIQGVVVMDILIDALGVVRDAKIISGPGAGLNEAALLAVRKFKFKAARVQDQSVAVRIRYGYRFVLEK